MPRWSSPTTASPTSSTTPPPAASRSRSGPPPARVSSSAPAPTTPRSIYCDGTDVLAISAGTAGGGGGAGALIELGDTDIAPRSIAVALANPDAEAGDVSGWTTTGTWDAGTAEGTIAAPHGGSFYFSATGGTDPAILEQTVDLLAQGFTAAELDAERHLRCQRLGGERVPVRHRRAQAPVPRCCGRRCRLGVHDRRVRPQRWHLGRADADRGRPGRRAPGPGPAARPQPLRLEHHLRLRRPLAQPLGPPAGDGRPPALRRQRLGRRDRGGGPGRCRPRRSRRRRCQRHDPRLRADPRGGRQLRPPCRRRRQRLDQGVRRRLRRRRHLHPLPGAPGHGAGLGRWPARDRLQRRRRHADLRHGPHQRRRHRRLGHRRRRRPLRHRRLLPGPARGRGDPAPARRLARLHAARRSDGSQGYAGTAPTAQADLDIRKNGASIGTITFAAAASTATFSFASEVAFAAGDRLIVLAPGSQDASLADISITFKGTRS